MARESLVVKTARAGRIAERLKSLYPAECALTHENPFQLLVATILSAQCTDERVNQVTPVLFARYPDAEAMAGARLSNVERIIRPTGFFRSKANNIVGASQRLIADFDGRIPQTLENLVTLPGIGRKTANVVLGTAFGRAEGVVVDTHVRRLSYRLGLTQHTDPVKIERDLMRLLPSQEWIGFSHRLIWHGRRICKARKPLCAGCALLPDCPGARKFLTAKEIQRLISGR